MIIIKIDSYTIPFLFIHIDRKDHRNGIYRPKNYRHESRRGVSRQ